MNIAVIFAGGVGRRMMTKDKPKQFLMVHGKPIIVHTIEQFENHPEIDGIICVIVEDWIPYMEEMKYRYRLDKIGAIVPGGATGQMSIYNGLCAAEKVYGADDNIVLIHDGVRPLIDAKTISDNIASVKENGTAVTCTVAKETVILVDDELLLQETVFPATREKKIVIKEYVVPSKSLEGKDEIRVTFRPVEGAAPVRIFDVRTLIQ